MKIVELDNKAPLVSIVMPVYNGEKFLAQALNSLITQTFNDIEIIVVDDGSTDNTKKIVDHFSFFRNLRYYKKENGGTGSALNYGHERALGKYCTWCSDDNVYFPHFILTLVDAMKTLEIQAEESIELVYGDFCFMREDGMKLRDVTHAQPQTGKDLIEGYDVGMAFLYTKALWDKTGLYWDRICEDFHWTVRAAQHTQFAVVNGSILAAFRVHGGQITGSRAAEEKSAADDCKVLAKELFGND